MEIKIKTKNLDKFYASLITCLSKMVHWVLLTIVIWSFKMNQFYANYFYRKIAKLPKLLQESHHFYSALNLVSNKKSCRRSQSWLIFVFVSKLKNFVSICLSPSVKQREEIVSFYLGLSGGNGGRIMAIVRSSSCLFNLWASLEFVSSALFTLLRASLVFLRGISLASRWHQ